MEPLKDIVVIYHADCPDGFGAAYAAWKKFGDTASYLPCRAGGDLPKDITGKELYIVDYSFSKEILQQLLNINKSVVVIDHHQTAKEAVTSFPQNIFDIDHSGAVLAWQYFHPKVEVPDLLRYVEDHDLWRFALPENRAYNVSVGETPMTFEAWDALIEALKDETNLSDFIAKGTLLAKFEDTLVAKIMTYRERVNFEGHEVWAINSSRYYRSILGNKLAELNQATGAIALGIVYYHSNGEVSISLRSRGDIDVAVMAQKFGGGGHKHAAAFRVDSFADVPFKFI